MSGSSSNRATGKMSRAELDQAIKRSQKSPTHGGSGKGHARQPRSSDAITEDGLDHSNDEPIEEGDSDTGEHDYPVPAGWDLDELTNEEFWIKVYEIEQAQEEGHKAFRATLLAKGFLSEGHFTWIRERFTERHGGDTNFTQSMMSARKAHDRAQLRQAVGAELLEPIEDVTLEVYAAIQARFNALSRQSPEAFRKLLAEYDLSEKRWARVHEAWTARLNDPANAVAAGSVNSEYRRLYAAALTKRSVAQRPR